MQEDVINDYLEMMGVSDSPYFTIDVVDKKLEFARLIPWINWALYQAQFVFWKKMMTIFWLSASC